jgi:hypothetical protein
MEEKWRVERTMVMIIRLLGGRGWMKTDGDS